MVRTLNKTEENVSISGLPMGELGLKAPIYGSIKDLVCRLKKSENYINFREILPMKMKNEEEAKEILNVNLGKVNHSHIKKVIDLIDEPYPYIKNGKVTKGPWFGRLLKSNTVYLYDERAVKFNKWFGILTNDSMSLQERIDLLLSEPNRIKGLNVGFMTLMLYILNKKNYSIWFEGQHNALKVLYPDLENYSGLSKQYHLYNQRAKEFVRDFDFDDTELDWLLSTGIQVFNKTQSAPLIQQNKEMEHPLDELERNSIEGIIDTAKNPFASADWIRQNRPLTTHRKEQLLVLFNMNLENIGKMNPNEGKYVAFVAIRWGFASVEENRLVQTEKWEHHSNYDGYGIFDCHK